MTQALFVKLLQLSTNKAKESEIKQNVIIQVAPHPLKAEVARIKELLLARGVSTSTMATIGIFITRVSNFVSKWMKCLTVGSNEAFLFPTEDDIPNFLNQLSSEILEGWTGGKYNKPRTAKVGAISKAQNFKGGPFGLCETPAGCKKFEKIERGTLWRHEKISQKNFNEIFEQCHSAEKCEKGDPLRFFDIHCVAKYRNKRRGDPLVQSKKLQKKC